MASITNIPFNITGTLSNQRTGYPIQDLIIDAYFPEPGSKDTEKSFHSKLLLGTGKSSEGGRYTIVWETSSVVMQTMCLLANCPETQFFLEVYVDPQHSLLRTPLQSASGSSMVINLAVPIPPKRLQKNDWTIAGKMMMTLNLDRLSDLVDQLILTPSTQSLFGHWSPQMRHNAIAQLEGAFLDPDQLLDTIHPLPSWRELEDPIQLKAYKDELGDAMKETTIKSAFDKLVGKTVQFTGVAAVDWQIKPILFQKSVSEAVTFFEGQYFGRFPWRFPPPQHPEVGYRDYLRKQWTSMVTLIARGETTRLTEQQAVEQLRHRFHQDFMTMSVEQQLANEILIPILIDILTSPPGTTFGFGIPSGQIPARGNSSARDYLDTLIRLSGFSAKELTLRYRTNFQRPDSVQSSAVWENIYTLQGFFRDSFQSVLDPSPTDPDIIKQFIVPDIMQGKAPFFLQYDEWLLQQQPIWFENYFLIREAFKINVTDFYRNDIQLRSTLNGQPLLKELYGWYHNALLIQTQLRKAISSLDSQEYNDARNKLYGAKDDATSLLTGITLDYKTQFTSRRSIPVNSLEDLNNLTKFWEIPFIIQPQFPVGTSADVDGWAKDNRDKLIASLVYLDVFILPVLIAQASLALGDFALAIFLFGRSALSLVGKAALSSKTAYRSSIDNSSWTTFPLYHAGNLPYTFSRESPLFYPLLLDDDSTTETSSRWFRYDDELASSVLPNLVHPVEALYFHLQMGEAMLQWADVLYREDDASSIPRARELYKGVYYLHGATPPIDPSWDPMIPIPGVFFNASINPAKASQLARAQLGFTQIEAGLNFFGYAPDIIPILRYSTLKSAADTFSASAKSVETDFLNAMSEIEKATIENMKTSSMLQRANLQNKIALEQAGIARDQIKQAQIAITKVQNSIVSLQNEIDDHDSFWTQLSDYFGGLINVVNNNKDAGDFVWGLSGEGIASIGATAFVGIGAWAVASYITMSSLADAQNERMNRLNDLQNLDLPNAEAQLNITERSATIADLNGQIAQADADLAKQLLTFGQDRFLSIEFWSYLVVLYQRVYRRYLDLAARMGWLAQRALTYEQGRDVSIVHLNYFVAERRGAGSADLLLSDLAALEANHLDGLQEMIPVKYTFSLARDFPLSFSQLLATGKCSFQTLEEVLWRAYPGTYSYRIISVVPRLGRLSATSPLRGLITNAGISRISGSDLTLQVSVRAADALPISEFNSDVDREVFGLPGSTLMQFEGSGVQSLWNLEFPAAANSTGLTDLSDVLITMNLRARFSTSLYQKQIAQMPSNISKFVFFSSASYNLIGLANLRKNSGRSTIAFNIPTLNLPRREKNRTLNNVVVLLAGGKNVTNVKATFTTAAPAHTIDFSIMNGTTFSTNPPITDPQSSIPPSPLNAVAGITLDQMFSIVVNKSDNPAADFSTVKDFVLGIDYNASLEG